MFSFLEVQLATKALKFVCSTDNQLCQNTHRTSFCIHVSIILDVFAHILYMTLSSWIWVLKGKVVRLVQLCFHDLIRIIFQLESVTYAFEICLSQYNKQIHSQNVRLYLSCGIPGLKKIIFRTNIDIHVKNLYINLQFVFYPQYINIDVNDSPTNYCIIYCRAWHSVGPWHVHFWFEQVKLSFNLPSQFVMYTFNMLDKKKKN